MSDKLCNRLHIDSNFVSIDISEAQQVKNMTKPAELESEFEFLTKEHSLVSSLTVADVAQFTVKGEGTVKEQNGHEDDYEWEERQPNYFEDFDHVRVKSVDFPKLRYPRPLKPNHRERGTNQNRSDKTKDVGERNKLLPKIILDASTTAILEKFIEDRYMGQYNDVIGRGKNSIVFHAECHRRVCMTMTLYNAVKVHKISSNEENNKLVYKRVQREFDHLNILYRYRDKNKPDYSPWPIRARKNVIIMSFIGWAQTVAPSIQDLPFEKDHETYHAIINYIDRHYNKLHLVHGKLSPKNILCRFETLYFIGWSHSVKRDHPLALSKLMRDCKFVTEFYAQRGVKVESTEDLFKKITQISKISSKLLKIINKDLYKKYDTNPNRTPSLTEPNHNGNLRFK